MTEKSLAILFQILILLGLYLTSLYSYLLFHSIVEIFSILIAFSIFVIAWNSRQFLDNDYLLFIGTSFLFVGVIDLLHTLAYKGMGVFRGYDANLPTQLWIAGRYVQSLSLFIAPLFLGRRLKVNPVAAVYTVITFLLLGSIFCWGGFPDCFVEGVGLTPFKKVSEYVICLILFASLLWLNRKRNEFDPNVLRFLSLSILLIGVSELAFTFYIDVYGFSNLVGHLLRLVSYYFMYKAIVETGLRRPYGLLFRNLKRSEEELEARVEARTEEIRRLNQELEQRVADRTAQLTAANKELEAFAYSVSHDLRAPLRGIDGFSQVLLEEYQDKIDAQGKNYLQRVRSAAQRMAQLIDDMLNLSRVSRGEMNIQQVNLSEVAREIADDLHETQPERQVEFVIHEGITTQGDGRLLRIVLENLIGNAWKFTSQHPTARIEFGLQQQNGAPVYFVRDDGAGFDMKYAQKLFGAFQRLHATTEFSGTGVGLATMQRVIHRHGGDVWAEGEVEKGATFYFTIP